MWGLGFLSWLAPAAGYFSWVNPVWGAVVTAMQAVWKAIKYFLGGVFSFLQNPQETTAVIVLVLIGLVFGIHLGRAWDQHLVVAANTSLKDVQAQMAVIQSKMEAADDADARRATEAVKAREAAEALERARIAEEVKRDPPSPKLEPLTLLPADAAAPVVALSPAAEPVGVRDVPAAARKVRRRVEEPSLLESFQTNIDKFFGITTAKN